MSIALTMFHRVRSRGRERLNVSCGIRGNGWCVTHTALRQVPYRAFSLAEDIEYGIHLGLSGYRVHYADEAYVAADMVSDSQIARTQRRRWEHGRFKLVRSMTWLLLGAACRQQSRICLDLALDLAVPPLSYLALAIAAICVGGALMQWWEPISMTAFWLPRLGLASVAGLFLYVLRGWQLSGVGLIGLIDLARAPGFIVWKVLTMLRGREPLEWVRTSRRMP